MNYTDLFCLVLLPFLWEQIFKTAWGFTANYPEMYDVYKLNVLGLRDKYFTIDGHKETITPQYYKNFTKTIRQISVSNLEEIL
ncbi:Uncharacterised protein [Sphingobacterium daejeonense]|nr:Uncharacterised protein [Sphingobacterium daejeonense]